MIKTLMLSAMLILVVGCKGISTVQVYPEGQGLKPLSETQEVYLTEAKEPIECKITKIADVEVASKTYGGASRVNTAIRKLARQKGGNAVINYNFWVAPNAGAFAAPHCKGTVVRADLGCMKRKTTSVDSGS